jgi:5-(aminomethyl)-3-furanmethanol phosphate kinase
VSAGHSPTVVKIGGSLAEGRRLTSIIDIVGSARRACVIVPGGGAFADAVRVAYKKHRLPEVTAHRMALLAMHQTGMMLVAMHARFVAAETMAGIHKALAESRIPVWLPLKLADADKTISADWNTTSDALAARLAERLGNAQLLIVKSCRVARSDTAQQLVRKKIVDPAFAEIVERSQLNWRVLGAGDEAELAQLLGSRRRSGRRVPTKRAIAPRR